MKNTSPTVVVAQLGARMHYAVPRMLHTAGLLERLYTDICATKGLPSLLGSVPKRLRPKALTSLLARHVEGVPPCRISTFDLFGIRYWARQRTGQAQADPWEAYLWAGKQFGTLVSKEGFGRAGIVYCFMSAALEVLTEARKRGVISLLEQTIAPAKIEQSLLMPETRHYGLGASPGNSIEAFAAREMAEWEAASLILCPSEFVRDGIVACGGPSAKCVVVPYGVDVRGTEGRSGRARDRAEPLHVLTVGAVGLRKGSHVLLEAARILKGRCRFRMVGHIDVPGIVECQLREHAELLGAVPRNEIKDHYQWADVFLLPSLCEGSATVVYEALAWGLPVICTPNTGSVIRDGIEGYIVPIRDAGAIARLLDVLAQDEELRRWMGRNAAARAQNYTLKKYRNRLLSTIKGAMR